MKNGFCDTLLKINNIYDIMNYNVMTLSICGVYFFFINNNLYNEIYKLKQKNCDLQNTVEKLKYELSKINKKELTIEPDIDELPGLEAPRLPSQNDLVLIDREN